MASIQPWIEQYKKLNPYVRDYRNVKVKLVNSPKPHVPRDPLLPKLKRAMGNPLRWWFKRKPQREYAEHKEALDNEGDDISDESIGG